jgi:hypothetical protein
VFGHQLDSSAQTQPSRPQLRRNSEQLLVEGVVRTATILSKPKHRRLLRLALWTPQLAHAKPTLVFAMPLITANSPHSVRVTSERLVAALNRRGIAVFARVDHSSGARAADPKLAEAMR